MLHKKLIIVDGYSFLFRAYFSMPALTRPSDGAPVGAVYGFISMMMKLLLETKPTHVVMVFDSGQKNFRHQIYDKYKANRPPPPDDLIPQFSLVREAARALNIEIMEEVGYEADDVIATLSTRAKSENEEVLIVSSDKDLMQLINDYVKMYDAVKSKTVEAPDVVEKFGVEPAKMRDLLALVGDASDNIPGVDGIGPKTAALLLNEYGDIEGIYNNLDKIKQVKRRESLDNSREIVRTSTKLVTLVKDLNLKKTFGDLKTKPIDSNKLLEFLHAQDFKSLALRAKRDFGVLEQTTDTHATRENITIIKTINQLDALISKAHYAGKFSIYLQPNFTHNLTVRTLKDIGSMSIAIGDEFLFFMPLSQEDLGLFDTSGMSFAQAMHALKPILEDESIIKILHDHKQFLHLLGNGELAGVDDVMLMSYDLGSGRDNVAIDSLLKFYFQQQDILENMPITKARARIATLSERELSHYTVNKALLISKAHTLFLAKLKEEQVLNYYHKIDKFLPGVVFDMEKMGIKIDQKILLDLSKSLEERLKKISTEVYKLAGEEFNIASTKQLSEVLFYKMNIAPMRKSKKTGEFLTDSETLEDLSAQGHTIADALLEWRKLQKIQTTYTTTLVNYIDKATGRIHTNFAIAYTSTGRFSSFEPNLQNIPARGEFATQIRQAFIAKDGYKILSADYSQIELRIVATMAEEKHLINAFLEGKDIHTITASEVFGIPLDKITPDVRDKAKAINFGIIYGISDFGLANNLRIRRSEAGQYIELYFKRYPKIKEYMERMKKFAREHGYVKTFFGRKCYIAGGKDSSVGSFADRAAVNFPIQGTSSDIMRKAMVDVYAALEPFGPKAKMILQIHDELLIEVEDSLIDEVSGVVKTTMENVVRLAVPLTVGCSSGKSWG